MLRGLVAVLVLAVSVTTGAFAQDAENILVIEVAGKANGTIEIELLPEVAPKHVEQIKSLVRSGAYDNVVFHRVIEGFMAQSGDVEFGTSEAFSQGRAGTGGSELGDIPAEFSDIAFDRGVVGMARSQSPDSANSQFFIMFAKGFSLNGKYTVFGRVLTGMDVVDSIQRGSGQSGSVANPDKMVKVYLKSDA
jgi:peptidylprolyl isomerase